MEPSYFISLVVKVLLIDKQFTRELDKLVSFTFSVWK